MPAGPGGSGGTGAPPGLRLMRELAAWRVLKISWPRVAAAIIDWLELGDRAAEGRVTDAVTVDLFAKQLAENYLELRWPL